MENNSFDTIIKQKIDHSAVDADGRAWDLFMLSAMDKGAEEIFDDASADALVREGLKDFKVAYDPNTWDLLANKIDAGIEVPGSAQHKFDKEISSSLRDLRRKYDASSWPKLAARLEAEEKYVRHYYRAKFVEAIVFFLLVITLFQISQTGKIKSDIKEFSNSTIRQETAAKAGNADIAPDKVSQHRGLGDSKIQERIFDEKSIFASAYNRNDNTSNINIQQSDLLTSGAQLFKRTSRNIMETSRLTGLYSLPVITRSLRADQINREIVTTEITSMSDDLVNSELVGFTAGLHEISYKNAALPALVTKVIKSGFWRIGMYTRLDYNQIYFPDQIVSVLGEQAPYKAKTVPSTGYGVGFKALYSHNQIGLETGLGYANRSYSPNRKYYIDPYYNADFANIEYEIVELPISLRYASKKDSRLRPYAQIGLNTNFITQANYDIVAESKLAKTFASKTNDLTAQQEYILSKARDQFTKFDKRRVLVYAQGAAGMEWKINSNADVYSQMIYGQRLWRKQFGPNFDQFKSLSLEIGLRTKI